MIIDILALGESIHNYDDANNLRIGVNDVNRFYPCEHLVVLNKIDGFTPERRKYIKDTFSHVHTIENLKANIAANCPKVTAYKMVYILSNNGTVKPIDIDVNFYHSRTSPLVAVMLAYRLGATKMRLFGVDLNTHYAYSSGNLSIIELRCWSALFKELLKKNIELIIPKHSKLFNLCQDLKK